MRYILFLAILLISCSTSQQLPSGQWSGHFSSMNKPDNPINLKYKVGLQQDTISLEIYGPQGMYIQTDGLAMTKDTLFFSYEKLDQTGTLSCALKKVNRHYYYGRCTDAEGKWAVFTMKHNSIDFASTGHEIGGCDCHKVIDTEK